MYIHSTSECRWHALMSELRSRMHLHFIFIFKRFRWHPLMSEFRSHALAIYIYIYIYNSK